MPWENESGLPVCAWESAGKVWANSGLSWGQGNWLQQFWEAWHAGICHFEGGHPYCHSVQFSSVAQLCSTLCDPIDCSTPGFPVLHPLLELAQIHIHWVGYAIQPSHSLLSTSLPTFNLSQHQGLFQGISSLCKVTKGLELQLQNQSFQWIFKTDFL